MWFFNIYKTIQLVNHGSIRHSLLYYNNAVCFVISAFYYKKLNNFYYISNKLVQNKLFKITFETSIVRFKYVGKAYRISKKKRILYLTLHYPTFNYVIKQNVKLKHKKKKKKLFKLRYITNSNIKVQLHMQMMRLRIPNTYTKRGIYNNIFIYYNRKRKISTHR